MSYIKRKLNYFVYNLKQWTWDRIKFQFYLWRIGGLNAGYFKRPNEHYFPIRVRLFDLWNFLFVKKINYDGKFGKGSYYEETNNPFRQKLSLYSITCGKGWDKLIFKLIKDCVKLGWNKEICQVKEKFGGLRFYINGASDEVHDLISKAGSDSYNICQQCGKPGKLIAKGWYYTTCLEHCDPKDLEEFNKIDRSAFLE